MKRSGYVLLKNMVANVVRGGATAAVAIVLPRFLTHFLDTDRFAAWSLILQIAGYASFLDFGLQTAVARFMAQAIESGQEKRKAQLIGTALLLLMFTALLALTLISLAIWQLPHLFHGIPNSLLREFRQAALVLSVSTCMLLPLSTFTGVLTGMQHNEVPALAIGGSRIVGTLAAVIAVHFTSSLPVLALCIGLPNLVGGLIQWAVVSRILSGQDSFTVLVDMPLAVDLLRFCGGLTVNALAMLLVSGLDLTIVGHYDFAEVGFYSIASVLISFVSGLTYAGLNALLAPVAALHARHETDQIRYVVFWATRVTVLINGLLSLAVFLWGDTVLRLWVGPTYASATLPILKILVLAQAVRLMLAAYSITLVSVGAPEKGIPGAICEAVVNFSFSIVGVIALGPIGVAIGTLFGAVSGLAWTLARVLPSVQVPRVTAKQFLKEAVLPGWIPCLPLVFFWLVERVLSFQLRWAMFVVCLGGIAWLGKQFLRPSVDRMPKQNILEHVS